MHKAHARIIVLIDWLNSPYFAMYFCAVFHK